MSKSLKRDAEAAAAKVRAEKEEPILLPKVPPRSQTLRPESLPKCTISLVPDLLGCPARPGHCLQTSRPFADAFVHKPACSGSVCAQSSTVRAFGRRSFQEVLL